jgi:tetratricopeptide (TPR) repeat protein
MAILRSMNFQKGLIILIFVFLTFLVKGQNSKQEQINLLYTEAASNFLQCIKQIKKNEDSVHFYSTKAISKLLQLYQLDSTSKSVGDYLADCYRYSRKYDSAIFWYYHQIKTNRDSLAIRTCSEFIALSFIANGQLDSSLKHLKTAYIFTSSEFNNSLLFSSIVNFADNIYKNTDSVATNFLNLKSIVPCKYSTEILENLLPYSDSEKSYYSYKQIKSFIQDRKKTAINKRFCAIGA